MYSQVEYLDQSEESGKLPIFGGIYGKEEERKKRQRLLI